MLWYEIEILRKWGSKVCEEIAQDVFLCSIGTHMSPSCLTFTFCCPVSQIRLSSDVMTKWGREETLEKISLIINNFAKNSYLDSVQYSELVLFFRNIIFFPNIFFWVIGSFPGNIESCFFPLLFFYVVAWFSSWFLQWWTKQQKKKVSGFKYSTVLVLGMVLLHQFSILVFWMIFFL